MNSYRLYIPSNAQVIFNRVLMKPLNLSYRSTANEFAVDCFVETLILAAAFDDVAETFNGAGAEFDGMLFYAGQFQRFADTLAVAETGE